MEEMDEKEFDSVVTTDLFNRMKQMIEEKLFPSENMIMLLKCIGYNKMLKCHRNRNLSHSELCNFFEKKINEEEKKEKEEKNEKLLMDLSECFITLGYAFPYELLSICVSYLLKVAMKKKESKETQKEVEMAFVALCSVEYYEVEKEMYLNEIEDIFQYHQEHHNLTRLAYQCAWQFLMNKLLADSSLKGAIVYELHFAREAARELEELKGKVDWKRKEEERNGGKGEKEELVLLRWLQTVYSFCGLQEVMNEEYIVLID
eukprot:MONOS_15519.1-p1 / transcript=MONOS_15519.1 / gene=MONOS_15519 / organism=Monocercomonoides_exilis_PA203 / gene_product=unspecified product / transcript_product=unspecified product / location=Mono_scaffold01259:11729-12565(+) / protein_length=259 / sequence_SO=supercontig / SO=protein_coding / is_pseudo=false